MNALTQELVELLSLEKIEENVYRGISRNLVGKRVFGGQVLGQALRAASYTTDRPAHSLHAYFLYGGDINSPILYQVDRLRDGKSFVSRQVRAIQHCRTIFTAMISFAHPEEGLNYQISEPEYPAPEQVKSEAELKKMFVEFVPENVRASFMRDRHIDIRPIDPSNPFQPQPEAPSYSHYLRTHDKIAPEIDELSLHQAIAAFYSDFTLMTTALRPHGLSYLSPSLQCSSIDHAMWFHRPVVMDRWLLYCFDSPISIDTRGFAQGQVFNRSGQLIASTAQEGLIRLR